MGTINLAGLLPVARAVVAAATSEATHLNGPPGLKQIIEPLPASALEGVVKTEPPPAIFSMQSIGIKTDEAGSSSDFDAGVFSPASSYTNSITLPESPCSGGGKIKSSPIRKKSTSSSSVTDEDDISNIPSLQMRIQIISQRVRIHIRYFQLF